MTRSFEQIFQQAAIADPENIYLTDEEVAIVMAGGSTPVKPHTIVQWRYRGKVPPPMGRGPDRTSLTRLSDVLALNAKKRRRGG